MILAGVNECAVLFLPQRQREVICGPGRTRHICVRLLIRLCLFAVRIHDMKHMHSERRIARRIRDNILVAGAPVHDIPVEISDQPQLFSFRRRDRRHFSGVRVQSDNRRGLRRTHLVHPCDIALIRRSRDALRIHPVLDHLGLSAGKLGAEKLRPRISIQDVILIKVGQKREVFVQHLPVLIRVDKQLLFEQIRRLGIGISGNSG